MTFSKFTNLLRYYFYTRINRKTSWGEEELKLEFERAISDVFIDVIDTRIKEGDQWLI